MEVLLTFVDSSRIGGDLHAAEETILTRGGGVLAFLTL